MNGDNTLPNDKFLDWSKFKALADDKINGNRNFKFVLGKVENLSGKKEKMLITSIFFFSQNVFKSLLFQGR